MMDKSATAKAKERSKREAERLPQQGAWRVHFPLATLREHRPIGRYYVPHTPEIFPGIIRGHRLYPSVIEFENPSVEAERSYDKVLDRLNTLEIRLLAATTAEAQATRVELHEAQDTIKAIKDSLDAKGELTIIDAIKHNPKTNIAIMCICLISVMVFSLLISALFGLHIINPLFALLSTIGWAGFWIMARLGR